ncbi:MAG: phosphatase PAP2 family protein [Candidatus Kryptoniota bacterium]
MLKSFLLDINRVDNNILIWINHACSADILNFIFFGLTFSASWIGVLLYAGADIFLIKDKKWKAELLFTLLMTAVISESLKFIVNRQRPYEVLHLITPFGKSGLDPSFPSGHTSFSFAIASSVDTKPLPILFYIWAFAVGLSRLYLGVHYPSDVLGGMVVGIVTGKMVKLISGGKNE